jgi:ATP-binding cassette subfamily E protein 1
MRLAVFMKDRCQPTQCAPSVNKPCIVSCPINRTGSECIVLKDAGFPFLTENLCTGCGICVRKCPFHCYQIVNVPDMLKDEMTNRYSPDGFALFRMIMPKKGKVLGIIGQNGTGKSTALRVLAGEIKMNLGKFEINGQVTPDWDEIIRRFRGSELQNFLISIRDKTGKIIYKPQNITAIPEKVKGTVGEVLKKVDETDSFQYVVNSLSLNHLLERKVAELSGGELQRFAIAAAVLRNGTVYLFDEPSSYLDIKERLRMAELINSLTKKEKTVIVVEHDLAILDYLSEYVCLLYGSPGAYGIISHPHGVRVGINIYLGGYIKDENMRFRPEPITFHTRPPQETMFNTGNIMFEYPDMVKTLGTFKLTTYGGDIHCGEVIGILGPNGIGKTTFIKLLSGEIKPDYGEVKFGSLKVSIKPQYISAEPDKTCDEVLRKIRGNPDLESPYKRRLLDTLDLENIKDRQLTELSGGELQRVAIGNCLGSTADIYLLDEPSAFLDVEMRLRVAVLIRKSIEEIKKCAFVVEHDIITQDFISDSLIVFEGNPGVTGNSTPPQELRSGMNTFLKNMGITFRRDPSTGRPRVNKRGSGMDQYQKSINEYYYVPAKGEKDEKDES